MSVLSTDYSNLVDISERVAWRLSDVVPDGAKLDFTKAFMPSAMFLAGELPFLSAPEKLKLNQIFGASYANLFYFVETYIIDVAMFHARAEQHGDGENLRALLRFADEEVKHQTMFQRFRQLFESGFGSPCDVVQSPRAVAEFIMSKSPMGVALVTLHLELVTQAHYVDSMRENGEQEPLFKSLFKHHWLEESQHAKLDALELNKLRKVATPEQVQQTVDDYFTIAGAFAPLLAEQGKLDVASLERAIGRTLPAGERAETEKACVRSYHRAFLWIGGPTPSSWSTWARTFPARCQAQPRRPKRSPNPSSLRVAQLAAAHLERQVRRQLDDRVEVGVAVTVRVPEIRVEQRRAVARERQRQRAVVRFARQLRLSPRGEAALGQHRAHLRHALAGELRAVLGALPRAKLLHDDGAVALHRHGDTPIAKVLRPRAHRQRQRGVLIERAQLGVHRRLLLLTCAGRQRDPQRADERHRAHHGFCFTSKPMPKAPPISLPMVSPWRSLTPAFAIPSCW
jgi:hypothetical protein